MQRHLGQWRHGIGTPCRQKYPISDDMASKFNHK